MDQMQQWHAGENEGGYPDETLMGIGAMGAMETTAYYPDLAPVGSASQGNYYPRDTVDDARALEALGYYPDADTHVGTYGSASADRAAGVGAWDSTFGSAVGSFQGDAGLVVDYWIGPQTRRAIKAALDVREGTLPGPAPPPPNVLPPPPPPPLPLDHVSTQGGEMSMGTKVAVGAGVLAVLFVGYKLLT